MLSIRFVVLATMGWALSIACCHQGMAQEAEQAEEALKEEIPVIRHLRAGLLDEAIQNRVVRQTIGQATSVSIQSRDGVTTTTVVKDGQKYVFVEDGEGLRAEFIRSYGPEDRDELKNDHPDLFMHVMAFPDVSVGAEVELVVKVKKAIQVASADELKAEHPELYDVLDSARPAAINANRRLQLPQIQVIEAARARRAIAPPQQPAEDKGDQDKENDSDPMKKDGT